MKKPFSSRMPCRKFHYCWLAQNKPKTQILFHKNNSLRDLYTITLRGGEGESCFHLATEWRFFPLRPSFLDGLECFRTQNKQVSRWWRSLGRLLPRKYNGTRWAFLQLSWHNIEKISAKGQEVSKQLFFFCLLKAT